ncbi:MAG TPA: hypothetical protein VM577_07140 [Anaerovoracaceae bacterium]|nr:hypothetical protein [Anaerovoracaceae bacterium]
MSVNTKYEFSESITTLGTRNDLVLVNNGNNVSIPFDNSLKIGTGSFVIAVWYKASSLPTGSNVVIEYGTTYPNGYLFNQFGSTMLVYFVSGPPTFSVGISSGVWYRFVLVGNANTGIVELWLNGSSQGTANYGSWNVSVNNATSIGAYPEVPIAAPGQYSDFLICKDSVSGFTIPDATAIQNDYTRFKDFSGISARYKLDEGTGTVIHNSVGSAPSGTLTSGSWSTFPVAYGIHCTNAALLPPAGSLVLFRFRLMANSIPDGYLALGVEEWQAVGALGGTALLSTATVFFGAADSPLSDTRADFLIDGYTITPVIAGVGSIDINWTIWVEYWVQ